MDNKNISPVYGNTIHQEGYVMENLITLEAVTYVVAHHFSGGNRKKQDLLLDLLCQKSAECERGVLSKEHEQRSTFSNVSY